ncbi:MAG: hypothetical protein SFV32_13020 [Opitutaceae bacterium]|nr:hypothetical protein [Opitutaceae bacterium]
MKSHRLLLSTLVLSSGSAPFVLAQQAPEAIPDENIPIRYVRPMRNTVSVGVKLAGSGANVKFQKLGSIARLLNTANVNQVGTAVYDNGLIIADSKGPINSSGQFEDAEGNPYVLVRKLKKNADGNYNYDGQPTYESIEFDKNQPLLVKDGRIYKVVQDPKYQRGADGKLPTRPTLDTEGKPVYLNDRGERVLPDSNGNYPAGAIQQMTKEYRPVVVNGEVQYELLPVGDDLTFHADRSRYWQIEKAEQFFRDANGKIQGVHMDRFSSVSQDATREGSGGSSVGVELGFEHVIRRQSLRFEWGFKGAVSFSTLNAKDNGSVTATLVRSRQTYLLADPSMPLNYKEGATDAEKAADPTTGYNFTSSFRKRKALASNYPDDVYNPLGDYTQPKSEYTVPLLGTPVQNPDGSWAVNTIEGDVQVRGDWQVKGATVNFRFGPSARFYFSPRFSISGSVGISAAYYSTRYNITETFTIPGLDKDVTFTTDQAGPNGQNRLDNTKKGAKIGPAGEVNVEWWLTPSTGFYVGGSFEDPGSYTQRIGDHEAKVDLGSGAGIRFGISTRF